MELHRLKGFGDIMGYTEQNGHHRGNDVRVLTATNTTSSTVASPLKPKTQRGILLLSLFFVLLFMFTIASYEYKQNKLEKTNQFTIEFYTNLTEDLQENNTMQKNMTDYVLGLKEVYRMEYERIKKIDQPYRVVHIETPENHLQYLNYTWTGCNVKVPRYIYGSDSSFDFKNCSMSMRPTISCKNTVYFCDARGEHFDIGDIILFQNPNNSKENVAHRIIGYVDGRFITRGDNNKYPDREPLDPKDILGKLYKIEG